MLNLAGDILLWSSAIALSIICVGGSLFILSFLTKEIIKMFRR
jgi:hypothetical protein